MDLFAQRVPLVEEADAVVALTEARARVWAHENGMPAEQWYATRLAGIEEAERMDFGLLTGEHGAVFFLGDQRAIIRGLLAADSD